MSREKHFKIENNMKAIKAPRNIKDRLVRQDSDEIRKRKEPKDKQVRAMNFQVSGVTFPAFTN